MLHARPTHIDAVGAAFEPQTQQLPSSFSHLIFESSERPRTHTIGVLEGEGIGPEVLAATFDVLDALQRKRNLKFQLHYGGLIGQQAIKQGTQPLSEEVTQWCEGFFERREPILCGPGGDRFVYDLRRRFDLYCKIAPLKAYKELGRSGRLKEEYINDVDIILVRDNAAGVYQGAWSVGTSDEGRFAEHTFNYSEKVIRRLMTVAAQVAKARSGKLAVVIKDSGIPSISDLWRDCAEDIAAAAGVGCSFLNIDYAAYYLVQHAQSLDVLVAPNLFGDVLGDVGAVLLGSRGCSYSGNYSPSGAAVYQTNHGCAHDLKGLNVANPGAQILSLAMLLRDSFGLNEEADIVEGALKEVWKQGWRTDDIMESGYNRIGTREMGELVAQAVLDLPAVGTTGGIASNKNRSASES